MTGRACVHRCVWNGQFGMGINIPHIERVMLWTTPPNLTTAIQCAARGTGGERRRHVAPAANRRHAAPAANWRREAPAANRRREAPAPRSTPSAEQPSPQKLKWTPFAPWRPPARRSRPPRAPGGRPGSRGRGRAGCGGRARPRGRAGPGKLGSHRSLGKTSKKGSNSLKHIGFGPPRERDSRYCPVQRESGHACGNRKSGGDPQSPFLPVSGLRPERGH